MADTQLKTRIILRNDTKGNWDLVKTTAILLKGEIGIEFDPSAAASTGYKTRMKVGDGTSTWDNLPYFGGTEAKVYQVEVAAGADHKTAIATAVGSNEKNSGDIAIVKELINASATGIAEHRQYTAYVYDSTLETPDWVAMDGNYNAENVFFAEEVMAYTNVGKITGASQTNPVKVVDAGKSVKDAFTAIFGTEVDVNPSITDNSANTMSQSGTGAKSAAEHGSSFSAANPTVTFTVANGGVAQYGLKTATKSTYNKRGANTAFTYPIKTLQTSGQNYNIRIEVSSTYHNIITVTAGTEVARSGNYIYCLLDSSNKVTLKLALPAGTYTQAAQTLCGTLKAYVEYNAAEYQGETVTAFCTYLNNDYTQKLTRTGITSSASSECTVPKGSLFPYYGQSTETTAPTSGLTKSTDAVCYTNGANVTMSADGYIWFALPVSKTKIQQYALGSWNDMATTDAGSVTFTLASGGTYSYHMYRTTAQQGSGSALQVRMN